MRFLQIEISDCTDYEMITQIVLLPKNLSNLFLESVESPLKICVIKR